MASRGINKVILVGNLGNDPEHRVLPSGGGVTNISLATSESWRDKNTGEQQERTEWQLASRHAAEAAERAVAEASEEAAEARQAASDANARAAAADTTGAPQKFSIIFASASDAALAARAASLASSSSVSYTHLTLPTKRIV